MAVEGSDQVRDTERLADDAAGVARAAELLRAGRLVAFPTETVYGLGADARNGRAVAGIFEAKGRPRFNPLIVHVSDSAAAERLVDLPEGALELARAFWPGPLTLVAPMKPGSGIADLVTAGLPTLAVRVPAHPLAQRVLAAFGGPVAAPSANPSGQVSPTTADHVLGALRGRIDAILDGGPCPVGLESTIIGFDGGAPVLLRPGGVAVEHIEAMLGCAVRSEPGEGISAPGQLASHYAPAARLRLNAVSPVPGEAWLGFGPDPAGIEGPALNLSPTGDLAEAAANLFAYLRALDAEQPQDGIIATAPVPDHGLGRAINDRLARAAAAR
ncbi:MAG: L-threonylcarbamoyladenylate synthase [Paracoccaceae bacterium]|nr:L-threonylcarbamoyladenylate synthase [Paracoccaceae bacterium]